MSKLVATLLLELAEEAPAKASLESVRADLRAASKALESGNKTDLALRLSLAVRAMFQEMKEHDSAMHSQEAPGAPDPFNN